MFKYSHYYCNIIYYNIKYYLYTFSVSALRMKWVTDVLYSYFYIYEDNYFAIVNSGKMLSTQSFSNMCSD